MTFGIMALNTVMLNVYAECRYAECHFMLNVVILSVVGPNINSAVENAKLQEVGLIAMFMSFGVK